MGYPIRCSSCGKETWATNIINLIQEHTETNGKIKCIVCGSLNASIYQKSSLQEKGEAWERYILGVIPITTEFETYTPYIFLTSQAKDGEVQGIHFNYFKDTRGEGGRLKHGHGPGGAPVLTKNEIFQLLGKLMDYGCMKKEDFEDFIKKL